MWCSRFCAALLSASWVLVGSGLARAADVPAVLPTKAGAGGRSFDWGGAYVGGHVGYTRGNAQVTLSEPPPEQSNRSFGAIYGGVQAGYNHLLPSGLLLGIEADLSFPNYLGADDVVWSRTTP